MPRNTNDLSQHRRTWSNALVITMDDITGSIPFRADVTIEGSHIVELSQPQGGRPDDHGGETIDATDLLIIPGLINAHMHSSESLYKGRFDNLPLDLWALVAYPSISATDLGERLATLRTQAVAIESLTNGVTCLLDDIGGEMPQSLKILDAVFDGYESAGIRAACSGFVTNVSLFDQMPFSTEIFTNDELELSRTWSEHPDSVKAYQEHSHNALALLREHSDRLRYFTAPIAPQRCTDELLLAAFEIADEHDLTFHLHVLEAKMQAIHGNEKYGRSIVRHLADLGLLTERTTLAHGIWLTEDDIDILSASSASVVHNPLSNLKLGSGILPWKALHDANVNVALGSDGQASNDSLRMFDVMKAAALLHKLTPLTVEEGPTASDALFAATRAGAIATRQKGQIGMLAAGYKADMVVLDLRKTTNFTPRSDLVNQLVYAENGSSIHQVWVDGNLVVEDGKTVLINQDDVLDEFRELADEFLERYENEYRHVWGQWMPQIRESYVRTQALPDPRWPR